MNGDVLGGASTLSHALPNVGTLLDSRNLETESC